MKKYFITLLSLVLLFSSCDLTVKPKSDLTVSGFWDTEEAARAAFIGINARYRTYAGTFFVMGEVRSDVWGGLTTETPSNSDLIKNKISSTMVYFGNWANFYGFIHNLNDFLAHIDDVPFKDENAKNHIIAQVYAIRAHMYYTMLRAWGDVPITTEPLAEIDLMKLKKPRAPKEEVMKQVKDDIAKSLEHFGTSNAKWLNKNVYWSRAAVLALKGDVYLWSGQVLGGGTADFTEAKTALAGITGFELVPWESLWGEKNEWNKEFIYAFDYQQDQAGNIYNDFMGRIVDFNPFFDDSGTSAKSVLGDGTGVILAGASRYGPSEKTLLLLDDTKDKRRNTFIRLYTDNAGYIPFTTNNPNYKTSVLNKFLGAIYDDGQRKNFNNVPLYRYADVLLMLAEAKNHLGEDPSGEINLVRARAYGSNFTDALKYQNSSKVANAKAILDERYKEFIGEGKRWWDLVRAGGDHLFNEVPTMTKAEAYKIYYSISESMLANDDQLTQTAGY